VAGPVDGHAGIAGHDRFGMETQADGDAGTFACDCRRPNRERRRIPLPLRPDIHRKGLHRTCTSEHGRLHGHDGDDRCHQPQNRSQWHCGGGRCRFNKIYGRGGQLSRNANTEFFPDEELPVRQQLDNMKCVVAWRRTRTPSSKTFAGCRSVSFRS
jgi:hypothetical protein